MIGNLSKPRLAPAQERVPSSGAPGGAWEVRESRPKAAFCFPRTAWVQKIKAASEQYIDTEKRKREKAYQGTWWGPGGPEAAAGGPRGGGWVPASGHKPLLLQ